MSLSLNNVAQTEFDALVKAASQSRGKLLMNTCRLSRVNPGEFVQFRKVGSVTANLGSFQQIVPLQDPNYQAVTATLKKFIVGIPVDDIQRFVVNFDARQEAAMLIGMALGRRVDQLKIDALEASATTNTIADDSTGFTFDKFRKVIEFFDDNNVVAEDRHMAISAAAAQDLMAIEQFTNIDFFNSKAIPSGSLDGAMVMGVNLHVIGNMTEGGLPLAANIRTCFAWQKMALGLGMQADLQTSIDEIPREDIWQVKGKLFAEAVAIDDTDIIKIDIDESV